VPDKSGNYRNLRVEGRISEKREKSDKIRMDIKHKMREKAEEVLSQIRPTFAGGWGDVELIDANEGVVTLRLTGACGGCLWEKQKV
jgi:hypothetical protein